MGFKHFIKELSGRHVSKKFKIYNDDTMNDYQEVDVETVRNIVVNKLAKELAEKPSFQHKTREEIEDNIRLREIKNSMGDLFVYKYSIFNRPLIPHSVHINNEDYEKYIHDKTDFGTDELDSPDDKEEGDDTDDSQGADDIVNRSVANDNDMIRTDFGS